MCRTVETHIVVTYYFDSDTTDIWVTAQVAGTQLEIIGGAFDAPAALVKLVDKVIREVVARPHF